MMDERDRDREDLMNIRNTRPQKANVQSILPGTNPLPGVKLDEAGTLLAEGKVKDAVFRLFALARAHIDRSEVMNLKDNGPRIWEHIRMVREEEFRPGEEDRLPREPYPGANRHLRKAIIRMRANREAVVVAFDFGVIREAYLSAYCRVFIERQGGESVIHGSGVYLKGGKEITVLRHNLLRDGLLLSSGKVTVVQAILREIHRAGKENFRKRERVLANWAQSKSDGFRDKDTVTAVLGKVLPEVLDTFDNEVSCLMGKLQKLLISKW